MRISTLILNYTIHFAYPKVYTKFHNFKYSSCCENSDEKRAGVTEGKIKKDGKMSFSIFFFIYTIHLAYLKVYTKFKNTGFNRNGDRSVTEIFIEEKEK